MSNELREKIEILSQQLKSLKQQRDNCYQEAKQWAEKRDIVNKQILDLRQEAKNARERRDAMNENVKALKVQRDQTRELIRKVIKEAAKKRRELRLLKARTPKQAFNYLKNVKDEIEWRIQTTPLTLQEEKPLLEKVGKLEKQLDIYYQINDAEEKIRKAQSKINTMNEEADFLHTRISEIAQQSQKFHNKIGEASEKVKILQLEANSHHQNFIREKQKSQKTHGQIIEIQDRIRTLKTELTEKEESVKIQRQKETRKQLKSEALEKLKNGRKLTLEEFKLLSDE